MHATSLHLTVALSMLTRIVPLRSMSTRTTWRVIMFGGAALDYQSRLESLPCVRGLAENCDAGTNFVRTLGLDQRLVCFPCGGTHANGAYLFLRVSNKNARHNSNTRLSASC